MMNSLTKILENLDKKIISNNKSLDDIYISDICTDTRNIIKDSIFICLKGAKFNSHDSIKQISQENISCIVVEEISDDDLQYVNNNHPNLIIIKVDNTRRALSIISINYFDRPCDKIKIIALTGTKGKTTTSFMIKNILENSGARTGLIGTVGVIYDDTHIEIVNTTPGSYDLNKYMHDMVEKNIEYLVMEVSSQAFKLDRVYGLKFEYGLFLNISEDHIGPDEHEDYEDYINCKMNIINMSKKLILNIDSNDASRVYNKAIATLTKANIITTSINTNTFENNKVDYVAENIIYDKEKIGINFTIHNKQFHIPLIGKYNVYNALIAITFALSVGIPYEAIEKSISKISVPGRCELVYKNENFIIMVDYAHNSVAMENLLSTLREFNPTRLVVVFGCGGNRSKERRYGMGEVGAKYADLNILTADNSRFEKTTDIINDIKSTLIPAGGKYIEIEDRREAIRYSIENARKGDLIAVIGKGHEPYNEVNGTRTHFLDSEEILKIINELKL